MTDIVDKATRSRMMSGIRGKDTKPEMIVRSALHARGFRFRLHYKGLPGKPDLVFPKHQAVIFINGCFWHGHTCHLVKSPTTNPTFWEHKISDNKVRDERSMKGLLEAGWRVLIIWECALKGAAQRERLPAITDQIGLWIKGEDMAPFKEISGI